MADAPRTYKLDSPLMRGRDIRYSQVEVVGLFADLEIDYPLEPDGIYDREDRSAYASLCTALGMLHYKVMEKGVTPELRSRLRHRKLTAREQERFESEALVEYRRALRRRFEGGGVSPPVSRILDHSNGYSRQHDGVDLICPQRAPALAICEGIIVANRDNWWGIGNPGGSLGDKGDGIIILRATRNVGPIREGMNFGYGHAEDRVARVGQRVKAGERIADAGYANRWHLHFMVNNDDHTRGIGDRDPWPFVDYARRNA